MADGRVAWIDACATGCVGVDSFLFKEDGPPKTPASKVVATWVPAVGMPPDTQHNGTPVHALGGRMYLFDPHMTHPVAADGSVIVDLYDPGCVDPTTGQPKLLGRWQFDSVTLNKKCLQRTAVGWSYSLVLPWPTYQKDVTRVEFRLCYQPKDGEPLYADPTGVTLGGQGGQPIATTQIKNPIVQPVAAIGTATGTR